jgi:TldD protein
MDLDKLADLAVGEAQGQGASYVDFRFEEIRTEHVEVSDGKPGLIDRNLSAGFGIRVLANGSWGFAAGNEPSEENVRLLARSAVEIAKTSAKINEREVRLAPVASYTDSYSTPIKTDPFGVSLSEKIEQLVAYDSIMRAVDGITSSNCFMDFRRISKFFASSVGSRIDQNLVQSGAGASCGVVKSRRI